MEISDIELKSLKSETDTHMARLKALTTYKPYLKLAIDPINILYTQSYTPFRFILRKMNNQNRNTLADFLNINIPNYNTFVNHICILLDNYKNAELYNIFIENANFIRLLISAIKTIRDIYNLKSDATKISLVLESCYNKLSFTDSLCASKIHRNK